MKQIYILLIICCAFSKLSAQCAISGLVVEAHECDDLDQFLVDVDFDHVGGTDTFEVRGNGNSYGFFGYDEIPVTIGPLAGNCDTNYEIVVKDKNIPECAADAELGVICCGNTCSLSEMIAEVDCNGTVTSTVFINFVHEGVGENFTLAGNGVNYGIFQYNSLPISVTVPADCSTDYEFVATDTENTACSTFIEYGEICCEICEIGELDINITDCNDIGEFFMLVNFEYANPEAATFTAVGNGTNYGTFEYSALPVTIGPLQGDCETSYELLIYDSENEGCAADAEVGVVCCDNSACEIGELDINITDCNDADEFFMVINFEFANPESASFIAVGNGTNYGTFEYSSLPVTIGPLFGDCDTAYELIVFDSENENCSSVAEIGQVCCSGEACFIGELDYNVSSCNDEGQVMVELTFEYANPISDEFTVAGNGVTYGTFAYTDLPVMIGPLQGDCETAYELVVFDSASDACISDANIGEICCGIPDCFIEEVSVEVDCDVDGTFGIFVNFEYEATTDSFEVRGNGNNYGTFAYDQLPVFIDGFAADCETQYEIVIVDHEQEDCSGFIDLGEVCCDGETCDFGEIITEFSDCSEDDLFFIDIDLIEPGMTSVIINIDGVEFDIVNVNDFPVTLGPFAGDCESVYVIELVDADNPDCVEVLQTETVCCNAECDLGELIVTYECDGEEIFYVTIDLSEYVGTGASFTILGNGNNYGSFNYSDLPIILGPIESNCDLEYEFVLSDNDSDQCTSVAEVGSICCSESECMISEVQAEYNCQNEELFDLYLNFVYENVESDSFRIVGNGNQYGTFAYVDLPIELEDLEVNCELEYEFIVIDQENENCSSFIGFEEICCSNDACDLGELLLEIDCIADDMFAINVGINGAIGTSESVNIVVDGILIASVSYDIFPFTLGNFEADCETEHHILLVDSENEACFVESELGVVCCEEEECSIDITGVPMLDCVEGGVNMTIEFDFEGVNGVGYDVFLDEEFYDFYSYDEQPLIIEGYESEEPEILITICENDDEDCCDSFTIDNPCFGIAAEDYDLTTFEWTYYNGIGNLVNASGEALSYSIYSVSGVEKESKEVGAFAQKQILTDSYGSGMYFLQLRQGNNYKVIKFAVVE